MTNPTASRCPNAQACSAWDQYGPDCEDGAVKPKCFAALHKELQQLQFFARVAAGQDALEQANQALRQQSRAAGAPGWIEGRR